MPDPHQEYLRRKEQRPLVSFVIPVYNEESVLLELIGRVRAVGDSLSGGFEIVFVDDGSVDNSFALLSEVAQEDKRVRILRLGRNFGHQTAITAGLDYCLGSNAVIMDADLQDPPELVPEMLSKRAQGFDVVYARRTKREGESLFKRATARVFYRVMAALAGLRMPENVGDFRLLSERAVLELRRLRETHRYLRGLTVWVGLRQTEVPYERPARAHGTTHFSVVKMVRFAIDAICSFSILPLRLATLTGLFFACACLGMW